MAKTFKLATAPWCGPCQTAKAMISSRELNVDLVNIDEDPDFAAKYGIKGIPTLLVFDENGTVVQQQTGNPMEIVKIIAEDQENQ